MDEMSVSYSFKGYNRQEMEMDMNERKRANRIYQLFKKDNEWEHTVLTPSINH